MTERSASSPPPDVCPRCHGFKEDHEKVCQECVERDAARVATDDPLAAAELGIAGSKAAPKMTTKEFVAFTIAIGAIFGTLAVLLGMKLVTIIREVHGSNTLPEVNEIMSWITPLGGGLIAELTLLMLELKFIKTYRHSRPSSPKKVPPG